MKRTQNLSVISLQLPLNLYLFQDKKKNKKSCYLEISYQQMLIDHDTYNQLLESRSKKKNNTESKL